MHRMSWAGWLLIVLAVLPMPGCATRLREPANLGLHKQELVRYVKSGQYEQDLAIVAEKADTWIEERVQRRKANERLAVVFDLDETLFFNWPQISSNDFGYVPQEWDKWVGAAAAPVIKPVYEVYLTALRHDVEVFFITGRPEYQRADTEENLRRIGCTGYDALILASKSGKVSAAAFKTAERARLTAEGRVIVCNIGDQLSDLAGGFSERTFKLPNPFYLTE